MDRSEYFAWLLNAKPGEMWCYYEGNLAMHKPVGLLARYDHSLLREVRNGIDSGLITSVQRRVKRADADGYGSVYQYFAVRQPDSTKVLDEG